jgi:uncharacterized membrane protein YfcA
MYSLTQTSVFFTHIAETNPDIVLGATAVLCSCFVMFTTSTCFTIINAFGLEALFFFYGALMLIACIYFLLTLRESRGLTDKQAKHLYWPASCLPIED